MQKFSEQKKKRERERIHSHGRNLGTLLHNTANGEPKRILKRELIFEHFGLLDARIRIVPLGRAYPADYEQHHGYKYVSSDQIPPNSGRKWRKEGEQTRRCLCRFSV